MNNKKYRFNIIDILIILVIVAVVAVMYYFTVARNDVATNSEVLIDYTVELKTVRAEHIDKIKVGDKAVETVRDQQIGEVIDVQIVPAYNSVTNTETGEMHIQTYPPINALPEEEIPEEETTEEETTEEDLSEESQSPVEESVTAEELKYDYYNVKVTLRDRVKKSENGYKKNAFDVIVGQLVHFRVPGYVSSGYCIDITEVQE